MPKAKDTAPSVPTRNENYKDAVRTKTLDNQSQKWKVEIIDWEFYYRHYYPKRHWNRSLLTCLHKVFVCTVAQEVTLQFGLLGWLFINLALYMSRWLEDGNGWDDHGPIGNLFVKTYWLFPPLYYCFIYLWNFEKRKNAAIHAVISQIDSFWPSLHLAREGVRKRCFPRIARARKTHWHFEELSPWVSSHYSINLRVRELRAPFGGLIWHNPKMEESPKIVWKRPW